MDSLTVFEEIADHFRGVVARVPEEQWGAPSNCEPWDARTLVSHAMVSEDLWTGVLIGERLVELGQLQAPPAIEGDVLDHVDATLERAKRAWREEGSLARTYETPMGAMPGETIITFPCTDLLCHAWDLGSCTGVVAELPDELVEPARGIITATVNDATRGLGLFGPATDPPADASPTEGLMALAGRPIPR